MPNANKKIVLFEYDKPVDLADVLPIESGVFGWRVYNPVVSYTDAHSTTGYYSYVQPIKWQMLRTLFQNIFKSFLSGSTKLQVLAFSTIATLSQHSSTWCPWVDFVLSFQIGLHVEECRMYLIYCKAPCYYCGRMSYVLDLL